MYTLIIFSAFCIIEALILLIKWNDLKEKAELVAYVGKSVGNQFSSVESHVTKINNIWVKMFIFLSRFKKLLIIPVIILLLINLVVSLIISTFVLLIITLF